MANIVVALVILAIVGLAVGKIVTEKRKGVKCVGCPYATSHAKSSNCSCDTVDIKF